MRTLLCRPTTSSNPVMLAARRCDAFPTRWDRLDCHARMLDTWPKSTRLHRLALGYSSIHRYRQSSTANPLPCTACSRRHLRLTEKEARARPACLPVYPLRHGRTSSRQTNVSTRAKVLRIDHHRHGLRRWQEASPRVETEKGPFVVFVQNAFPGQTVDAQVVKCKSKHAECRLLAASSNPLPFEVDLPYQAHSRARLMPRCPLDLRT